MDKHVFLYFWKERTVFLQYFLKELMSLQSIFTKSVYICIPSRLTPSVFKNYISDHFAIPFVKYQFCLLQVG